MGGRAGRTSAWNRRLELTRALQPSPPAMAMAVECLELEIVGTRRMAFALFGAFMVNLTDACFAVGLALPLKAVAAPRGDALRVKSQDRS